MEDTINDLGTILKETELHQNNKSVNADKVAEIDVVKTSLNKEMPSPHDETSISEVTHHGTEITTKIDNLDLEVSDVCKFDGRRRSEPMNGLLMEQFSGNLKGKKEDGFKTDRPLVWYKAIREYVLENGIVTRCEIKKQQKNQRISIIKIHLTFRETKEVTISVKFVNGVLLVNGRATDEWVKHEFAQLKVPRVENYPVVNPDETRGETATKDKVAPLDAKDITDEITCIWSSVDELKKAFKTIENSLKSVIEKVENIGVRIDDNVTAETNKRKEMELKLDQKDSLARELLENEMKKRTDKITVDLNNKISSVKDIVSTFKAEINRKIEVFNETPGNLHNNLTSRMDSIEANFNGLISAEEVRIDLDKMDEDHLGRLEDLETKFNKCEKETRKIPEIERNIEVCRRQLTSVGTKISNSELNLHKLLTNKVKMTHYVERPEDIHVKPVSQHLDNKHLTHSEEKEAKVQFTIPVSTGNTPDVNNNNIIDFQETNETLSIPDIQNDTSVTNEDNPPSETSSVTNLINEGLMPDIYSMDGAADEEMKTVDNNTELIMCFDSNAKHINQRKLWDLDGTKHIRCGTLDDVMNVIDSNIDYTNLKYFFISCGCNDLDYRNGGEVFTSMKAIVEKLKILYPHIKIILSEVTPRMDAIDEKVKVINFLLDPYAKRTQNVFLVNHSNMRRSEFFAPGDSKHFLKEPIPLFVSNIKSTIRFAYGRKKFVSSTVQ